MEPLSLWKRFINVLWTPFVWTQCTALNSDKMYCVRRRFHFGMHRTFMKNEFK